MGMSSALRWCCSGHLGPSSQRPRSQRGQTARLVLSCLYGQPLPLRSHLPVRQYSGQYTILDAAPGTSFRSRCCCRCSCLAAAGAAVVLLLLATPPLGFRAAGDTPASGAANALRRVHRCLRAAASPAAAAAETSLKRERRCTLLPLPAAALAAAVDACRAGMGCKAAWPAILAGKLTPGAFTAAAAAFAAACPLDCRCSDRESPLPRTTLYTLLPSRSKRLPPLMPPPADARPALLLFDSWAGDPTRGAATPPAVPRRAYRCHFLLLLRAMLAGAVRSPLLRRCPGVAAKPPRLAVSPAAAAAGDDGSELALTAVPPAAGLRQVREPCAVDLTAVRRRLLPFRPPFLYTSTRCCCWPCAERSRTATVDLPLSAVAAVCPASARLAAGPSLCAAA